MAKNNAEIADTVSKAISGNRQATEQLTDLYYQTVFRMVYYRTRSKSDAEDLTQEIFMQMVKYLPRLKDKNRFRPWLFRIALNKVYDFHRKKQLLTFFGSISDNIQDEASDNARDQIRTPADELMRKEFWRQFRQLGDSLPRQEREVFLLRFADEQKIKEIALILKKSESTVKTHLYRALKKFRQNSELRNMLKGELG
ncbi:RNA polymerase sigma factor [Desulfococcaceae bacterium HSG7]|nr:RNA polymerase sigma factor [Desulfococcaceae bacterium HSG7]